MFIIFVDKLNKEPPENPTLPSMVAEPNDPEPLSCC